MPFLRCKSILFLVLVFVPALGWSFADNNVRRDRFKWMVVQTEHFDIYYDEKTARMVPRMAQYLEGAWKEVGDMYGYHVPTRTPFFFYSNHNLFEQTNIVQIDEGTGGVTEAFKNRLLIFNDGSQEWLRHVIYHEFTHVVQFNILYGGWWKSVRLLKSPFYPLWMMEGSAEHGSGDIDDATEDMVVRDAVANNQLPDLAELHGFAHLKPNQVTLGYKTGDAAMEFLQEEYGTDKLGKMLFTMKDYFRRLERSRSDHRHGLDPVQSAFSRMDERALPHAVANRQGRRLLWRAADEGKRQHSEFQRFAGALRRRKNHLPLQRPRRPRAVVRNRHRHAQNARVASAQIWDV